MGALLEKASQATSPSEKPATEEEKFVTVDLRRDAIAHLKWLNEEFIKVDSLDDALDEVISLAADAYRQKDQLRLSIKPSFPRASDTELVSVEIRETAIAHLKWLNNTFIKENSLDDALDRAISLAAFIHKQIKKGVIIEKSKHKGSVIEKAKKFVGIG